MELQVDQYKKSCSCGRDHRIEVKKIVVDSHILSIIPGFIYEQSLGDYPVILCDTNTYQIGGLSLQTLLGLSDQQVIVLNAHKLHADEFALQAIKKQFNPKASVLIAVGSGTIHDLTRYCADEFRVPFISVPTAASVDGFASTVAAMTFNGFKVTTPAVAPLAIFADTSIIAKAPKHLSAAGVGDLLAKYTALLDWKISHLLTGEYICWHIVSVMEEALKVMQNSLDDIANQTEEGYVPLMVGLMLCGIGMQMIGNSRPASGAEHHLSHLWEMQIINDEVEALHGEKVGVGLILVADFYRTLLSFEEAPCFNDLNLLDEVLLESYFKQLTPDIVKENHPDPLEVVTEERFKKVYTEILQLIRELPSSDQFKQWLETVGGKVTVQELGLPQSIEELSLSLAPYVRGRLTLLRVMKRLQLSK